jgi:hypothetical protein
MMMSACDHVSETNRTPTAASPTAVTPVDTTPPSAALRVTDQPWDAVIGNSWNYLRRTSSKDADIITDVTAPSSPPRVLRITFTPGMGRDTEPGVNWTRLSELTAIHASWWIKLSANWISSPAGAAKMTFLHATAGQGQAYTALTKSRAPHSMIVNTEWNPYGQKVWEPNVATTPIVYDHWYRIEWYVKWESMPRAADGILQWWIDGVLNGDYRNVNFPAVAGFEQFEFAPTVQQPPPVEQYMYIDHTWITAP